MSHVIVWFEIPVKDLSRAITFYSQVLNIQMTPIDRGDFKIAFFPSSPEFVAGMLIESKDRKSSKEGTLIYLNGGMIYLFH